MNKTVSILLAVFILTPVLASAQAMRLDAENVAKCNQVVSDIFNDITKVKDQYTELKDLSPEVLTKNKYGLYTFRYRHDDTDPSGRIYTYEIALSVVGLGDANPFATDENAFDLGFPLLGLKFAGYQKRTFKSRQFDMLKLVQQHGIDLWALQQKYIPYQLSLKAVKEFYKVGESIEFIVTLKNLTKKNIIVNDLNDKTIFFLYDNQEWGASEVSSARSRKSQEVVLEPNQSISTTFTGSPFYEAREFQIFASYAKTYEGIQPSGTLKIKVVK